jgi:hypothetical protein
MMMTVMGLERGGPVTSCKRHEDDGVKKRRAFTTDGEHRAFVRALNVLW